MIVLSVSILIPNNNIASKPTLQKAFITLTAISLYDYPQSILMYLYY